MWAKGGEMREFWRNELGGRSEGGRMKAWGRDGGH
jgi:hypothetical protein